MIRRYMSTKLLEEGMVIDQSIVDRTGRIFIARKTILDASHIDALLKMNIPCVYIQEGKEETLQPSQCPVTFSPHVLSVISHQTAPDLPMVTLSEKMKKRISHDIQHLYSQLYYQNFSSGDFTDILSSVSDAFMDAIAENDAVAFHIHMLKLNDEFAFQHSVDVALISMIVARKAGFPPEDIRTIGIAGLLHDIGKLKIPSEILNKPDRLTDEEFSMIKKHPELGNEITENLPGLNDEIKKAILQHHEKMNGTGYPYGLAGSQISPYAKILSVADIYDALVKERPYKKALSQHDAIEMIMAMTNDLDVVTMRYFLDSVILYPVGSVVRLSSGQYVEVVQNTPHYPLRPKTVDLKTGAVYDLSKDLHCANLIIE